MNMLASSYRLYQSSIHWMPLDKALQSEKCFFFFTTVFHFSLRLRAGIGKVKYGKVRLFHVFHSGLEFEKPLPRPPKC